MATLIWLIFLPFYLVQCTLRIVHDMNESCNRSKASGFVHYHNKNAYHMFSLHQCFDIILKTLVFWHFNDNSHTITHISQMCMTKTETIIWISIFYYQFFFSCVNYYLNIIYFFLNIFLCVTILWFQFQPKLISIQLFFYCVCTNIAI